MKIEVYVSPKRWTIYDFTRRFNPGEQRRQVKNYLFEYLGPFFYYINNYFKPPNLAG
jgi:hypothetical protein